MDSAPIPVAVPAKMPLKIIFEGNHCRVVEERTQYECTTEEMLEQYRKTLPVKTKMMPRNTFYYERREDQKSVYVIEHTPRLVKVKWKDGQRNGDGDAVVDVLRLSLPFVYFMFLVKEDSGFVKAVYPVCTKKPVKDEKGNDLIFKLPVPNIHNFGLGISWGFRACFIEWNTFS